MKVNNNNDGDDNKILINILIKKFVQEESGVARCEDSREGAATLWSMGLMEVYLCFTTTSPCIHMRRGPRRRRRRRSRRMPRREESDGSFV